jgi:prevent-host-death family protein
MRRTLSLSEAKMKLSGLVDAVEGTDEEVVITRNGRPAAVRVSPDEFESWKETVAVRAKEGYAVEIDVDAQTVTLPDGTSIQFDIDPFLKQRLLNGWDQIGLTLRHEDEITAYERKHGIG